LKLQRHITAIAVLSSLLFIWALVPTAAAQSTDGNGLPSLVEVYWQWSRTITTPALSNMIVLDQEIARVESTGDGIQIFGLARGETVLLGYLNDKPVSIRVRVVPRPQITISPAQLRRQG
jgi:hypothetical protein